MTTFELYCASNSDGVCILKECARLMAEQGG